MLDMSYLQASEAAALTWEVAMRSQSLALSLMISILAAGCSSGHVTNGDGGRGDGTTTSRDVIAGT